MMINLKHPLYIAAAVLIIIVILLAGHFRKKSDSYDGGLRSANSLLLMQMPEFQAAVRQQKIISIAITILMILSILSASILAARPFRYDEEEVGIRRRDIMLCMDTSFYIDDLNGELISAVEEIVRGLEGDRFGVSLYSSSSFLFVPLTDDYDYVIEKLEELREYFELGVKLDQYYGGYYNTHGHKFSEEMQAEYEIDVARMAEMGWISKGTHYNNYKGAFLVGDGLASCLYSFPMLEEEGRSRVIILSTENAEDKYGKPLVRLPEAADYCREHDVTVYGLFRGEAAFLDAGKANNFYLHDVPTDATYESAGKELKECVEKTGGKFYEYGKGMSPEEMVRDISSQEAMQVKNIVIEKQTDMPEVFVLILCISIMGILLLEIRRNM